MIYVFLGSNVMRSLSPVRSSDGCKFYRKTILRKGSVLIYVIERFTEILFKRFNSKSSRTFFLHRIQFFSLDCKTNLHRNINYTNSESFSQNFQFFSLKIQLFRIEMPIFRTRIQNKLENYFPWIFHVFSLKYSIKIPIFSSF